jgi:hypothetical protein
MPHKVQHVRQKHTKGCVIACLSMVTGIPYDEVALGFHGDRDKEGLGYHAYDCWLNQLGYAVLRRFSFYSPLHADRTAWPCEPFADAHLVEVPSPSGGHALVLLGDGSVFDPNESPAARRLSDYAKVNWIAGVFRVCEPFSRQPLIGLHWTHGSGKCTWCGADGNSYHYHDACPGRGTMTTP